jgi:hypothetical protein
VAAGSTSRSPWTTTQPLARSETAASEAALSAYRSRLRGLRLPGVPSVVRLRSLLIR